MLPNTHIKLTYQNRKFFLELLDVSMLPFDNPKCFISGSGEQWTITSRICVNRNKIESGLDKILEWIKLHYEVSLKHQLKSALHKYGNYRKSIKNQLFENEIAKIDSIGQLLIISSILDLRENVNDKYV